ncbi:tripartite tricarboxylate transporter substrate binding protein [Paralcaligenes sp. KSB-10]|uniref:Bug family tripartite tricarboxylate transporter substrate binding protein n=1 Tax=Paralcaligenes sp. KSB-10 TaxID=2901142 RepID=UPI001E47F91E|nr:tripartite tricarboxylate transporter substrate binding protein [Paralcaligenes sp. KSB-10]UHL66055.1 tripartite tricarboxylate transporter substrate binding protein [Paralcaligenes sp. KSB-10]
MSRSYARKLLQTKRPGGLRAALLSAIMLPCFAATASAAGAWPQKPVKVIVAFTAGGTTDILAREVAAGLTTKWGQSVVVENKPGAGGNIGTQAVINSAPDGYTILINSIGPIAINPYLYKHVNFSTIKDLKPITMVADVPNVLVVAPSLKINSVKQLVEAIKSKPDFYNCASTGVGTAAHISCEEFAKQAKLKISHVPYKGAGALTDVVAGRVQFMFATLPSVIGFIKAGTLVPLAVSTAKRSPVLADVPTMQEQGFPKFALGSWFGYFAPAATPDSIVKKISLDINSVIKEPTVRKQLLQQGAEPVGGTPEEFGEFVRSENKKWSAVVKEMGISLD